MKLTDALKHGVTVIEDQIHVVEDDVRKFLGRIRGDVVELTDEGIAFFERAVHKTAGVVDAVSKDATTIANDVASTAQATTGAVTGVKAVETAVKAPN